MWSQLAPLVLPVIAFFAVVYVAGFGEELWHRIKRRPDEGEDDAAG